MKRRVRWLLMVCLLTGAEAVWSYGIYNNSHTWLHVVGEVCPACFAKNLGPGQDGFCPGNDLGCRGNTKISFWPVNDESECMQAPVKVTAHGWVIISDLLKVEVYNDKGEIIFSGAPTYSTLCIP